MTEYSDNEETQEPLTRECPHCGYENAHILPRKVEEKIEIDNFKTQFHGLMPVIVCDICNTETPIYSPKEINAQLQDLVTKLKASTDAKVRAVQAHARLIRINIWTAFLGGFCLFMTMLDVAIRNYWMAPIHLLLAIFILYIAKSGVQQGLKFLMHSISAESSMMQIELPKKT